MYIDMNFIHLTFNLLQTFQLTLLGSSHWNVWI